MSPYKRVLAIAGSDSGGGAGIQADIKTISALGCFATTAITSLTAQNTLGVQAIEKISPLFVSQQIKSVLEDIGTDSIKIGMLHHGAIIESITRSLHPYPSTPVVFDPVMVSTNGDILLEMHAIEALKKKMLPISTVITPNLKETEILSATTIHSLSDIKEACRALHATGAANILVTGGDEALDVLFMGESQHFEIFETPKVKTQNTHGSGCTYSSAIASHLALGHDLIDSIRRSKAYIYGAITSAKPLGRGHGPVNHFFRGTPQS